MKPHLAVLAVWVIAFVIPDLVEMKANAFPFAYHRGGYEFRQDRQKESQTLPSKEKYSELIWTSASKMEVIRFEKLPWPSFYTEKRTRVLCNHNGMGEDGNDFYQPYYVSERSLKRDAEGRVVNFLIRNRNLDSNSVPTFWVPYTSGFASLGDNLYQVKMMSRIGTIVMVNRPLIVINYDGSLTEMPLDGLVKIWFTWSDGRNRFSRPVEIDFWLSPKSLTEWLVDPTDVTAAFQEGGQPGFLPESHGLTLLGHTYPLCLPAPVAPVGE